MTTQIIIAITIMLVVLMLTLISISKGYAYKHTIDPKPGEQDGGEEPSNKKGHTEES